MFKQSISIYVKIINHFLLLESWFSDNFSNLNRIRVYFECLTIRRFLNKQKRPFLQFRTFYEFKLFDWDQNSQNNRANITVYLNPAKNRSPLKKCGKIGRFTIHNWLLIWVSNLIIPILSCQYMMNQILLNLKLYKRLIKIYLNPVPGFDVVSDEAIFMGSSSPGLSAKSQ